MEFWSIILITILYALGCTVTFAESWREQWWYVPLGVFIGMMVHATWFFTCKEVADKERILILSLIWDSIQVIVFYGLPILLFGVRMDKMGYVGAALILAGIVCLKMR